MKHCLILDDSASIRKVGQRILESFGIGTVTAENPKAALEACGTAMPDCIVVDWSMPGFDPLRFMAQLRRMPGGHRAAIMPCVFENDSLGSGGARIDVGDAKLLKPFDRASVHKSFAAAGLI